MPQTFLHLHLKNNVLYRMYSCQNIQGHIEREISSIWQRHPLKITISMCPFSLHWNFKVKYSENPSATQFATSGHMCHAVMELNNKIHNGEKFSRARKRHFLIHSLFRKKAKFSNIFFSIWLIELKIKMKFSASRTNFFSSAFIPIHMRRAKASSQWWN